MIFMKRILAHVACTAGGLTLALCSGLAIGDLDLKRLPLGDGHLSTQAKVGYIWPCHLEADAGGAFRDGPWIHSDGTYDFTAKAVVDGNETWPNRFTLSHEGYKRVFSTNDLPNHGTGRFPIEASDDAYQYDRNPNRIREQTVRVELPLNPALASSPSCAPGAIGILLTGSVLFSALDALGRDAVAHETQDKCQGHPQQSGVYHYHSISSCLPDDSTSDGHSKLAGYALDGFGIYGRRGEGGKTLTSADLDECHGHTHRIDWEGKSVTMYHYHATWDFPYSVGCLRGSYSRADVEALSGPRPTQHGGDHGQGRHRMQEGGEMMERPGGGRRSPPDLAAAASKLGISESRLRQALGPPPPDLEATASQLGISVQKLREALGPPPR